MAKFKESGEDMRDPTTFVSFCLRDLGGSGMYAVIGVQRGTRAISLTYIKHLIGEHF